MFARTARRAGIKPPLTPDEAEEKRCQYLQKCSERETDAYSFADTINLTSEQLLRLCALQVSGGYNTPWEAFNAMLRTGSYFLINARLDENEKALRDYWAWVEREHESGAETRKEESG